MNYMETLDHLINVIAQQEGCSRTKAYKLLAFALGTRLIADLILWTIAERAEPPYDR